MKHGWEEALGRSVAKKRANDSLNPPEGGSHSFFAFPRKTDGFLATFLSLGNWSQVNISNRFLVPRVLFQIGGLGWWVAPVPYIPLSWEKSQLYCCSGNLVACCTMWEMPGAPLFHWLAFFYYWPRGHSLRRGTTFATPKIMSFLLMHG